MTEIRRLCVLGALSGLSAFAVKPGTLRQIALTPGLIIDHSVTIIPGTYRLVASGDLKRPAIIIRGSNITVEMNGAVLDGSSADANPDEFAGVGILIDGGSHVTVTNATVRGYKVGMLARDSPDLHLTGNDLSYNWKQRLYSGIEKESLVDWMSYHQNEKDEWLRYGAGIYLRGCDRAEVDHNTAVQGQNGLMVTDSSHLKIWNNTFQFLSSIGVGLYRVTHSTIMHNRIDWCVRGYSHGFYNRGQDSAGLLMYEQSSNNTVAYNSVTHGGDGLFLWAGQSTMDTGKGGANDNLFYRNDFSHAPTNGIEATFSRNIFVENRVEENWHGVWGGYSYDSLWQANRFSRNSEAIAIEHGQDNVISGNTFDRNDIAIRLWQNATQDPDWGYPKNRDTRSRGYRILANTLRENQVDYDIKSTLEVEKGDSPARMNAQIPERLAGGIDPMIKDGERRGRSIIIVDEWGPYDWKSLKLWPVLDQPGLKGPDYNVRGPVKLNVLGPAGAWRVTSTRGARVTPTRGRVGDVVTVTPAASTVVDVDVALEYRGAAVSSPRGTKTRAGAPYTFRYSRFFAPIDWAIRFVEYSDATDPIKEPQAFTRLSAGTGAKTVSRDRIDYISGRVIEEGVAPDKFAFTAEGRVSLPAGDYTLQVISDDGARVWMDGKLLLDAWQPHESRVDTARIAGGRHAFRVDYYEIGGWSEIRFDIQPRRTTR
ncbi:MAG: right-handed parallel beta-helix repeat-containing protein [Vicinamibacterales bacterium]